MLTYLSLLVSRTIDVIIDSRGQRRGGLALRAHPSIAVATLGEGERGREVEDGSLLPGCRQRFSTALGPHNEDDNLFANQSQS